MMLAYKVGYINSVDNRRLCVLMGYSHLVFRTGCPECGLAAGNEGLAVHARLSLFTSMSYALPSTFVLGTSIEVKRESCTCMTGPTFPAAVSDLYKTQIGIPL